MGPPVQVYFIISGQSHGHVSYVFCLCNNADQLLAVASSLTSRHESDINPLTTK